MSPHNPYLPAASTVPLTEDNEALKKAAAVQRGLSVSPPPSEPPEEKEHDTLEMWRTAALVKDRTRRAIRERITAGENHMDIADDFKVPLAFVSHLGSWQLFGYEEPLRDPDDIHALIEGPAAPPEPEAAPPQPVKDDALSITRSEVVHLRKLLTESRAYASGLEKTIVDAEEAGALLGYPDATVYLADIIRDLGLKLAALSSPLPSEPKPALEEAFKGGFNATIDGNRWRFDDMALDYKPAFTAWLAASPVSAVPPTPEPKQEN